MHFFFWGGGGNFSYHYTPGCRIFIAFQAIKGTTNGNNAFSAVYTTETCKAAAQRETFCLACAHRAFFSSVPGLFQAVMGLGKKSPASELGKVGRYTMGPACSHFLLYPSLLLRPCHIPFLTCREDCSGQGMKTLEADIQKVHGAQIKLHCEDDPAWVICCVCQL